MKNLNLKNAFILIAFILSVAFASIGATNYVKDGSVINLKWATTSPTTGLAVVKGTTKAAGCLVGVALNGTGVAADTGVSVATRGIFKLPVTASSTVGNVAVGDYIYGTLGGIEVSTTVLSNVTTGICFGQALEPITASTTHGVLNTIKVLVHQPGHI